MLQEVFGAGTWWVNAKPCHLILYLLAFRAQLLWPIKLLKHVSSLLLRGRKQNGF